MVFLIDDIYLLDYTTQEQTRIDTNMEEGTVSANIFTAIIPVALVEAVAVVHQHDTKATVDVLCFVVFFVVVFLCFFSLFFVVFCFSIVLVVHVTSRLLLLFGLCLFFVEVLCLVLLVVLHLFANLL